jgi:hypothetical protein
MWEALTPSPGTTVYSGGQYLSIWRNRLPLKTPSFVSLIIAASYQNAKSFL